MNKSVMYEIVGERHGELIHTNNEPISIDFYVENEEYIIKRYKKHQSSFS